MRRFYLNRLVDETGMSGTGRVAEGVLLPNGMAVMWWLGKIGSVQIYDSIDELHEIHSHGRGTSEVIYEMENSNSETLTDERGRMHCCNCKCFNR